MNKTLQLQPLWNSFHTKVRLELTHCQFMRERILLFAIFMMLTLKKMEKMESIHEGKKPYKCDTYDANFLIL